LEDGAVATVHLGIEGLEDAVEIGRGGFGSVYRAQQRALRRTVAVKLLRDAVQDERVRLRFERECWAMGTLASHPNIITVHGSGFTAERGQPYIVMDYMTHGSLADRLEQLGTLPWEEVLSLGVKLAGALETAHRSGVLHRDIKPENVLLSKYGEPQLADFGIARLQGAEETKTDTLTASIAHVSPELLAGESPSAQSDVFALGSTLFMLLNGSPAFIRDTDQSIVPALTRITSEPVPDLRPKGVPDALCEVIEQMMAKSLAERIPTSEAAGRKLQECQRRLGQGMCPLTIIGEPSRRIDPNDGATNAIGADVLAALKDAAGMEPPALVEGTEAPAAPSVRGEPTNWPVGTEQPVPPSPADEVVSADAAPARTKGRSPAMLAAAGLVAVAVVVGGVLLVTRSAPEEQVAQAAETEADADPAESPGADTTDAEQDDDIATDAALTAETLRRARLEPDELEGSWVLDPDMAALVGAPAPAYLCTGASSVAPAESVAYRAGTPGPRVAQSLRILDGADAEALMASLPDEVACLRELPGITDVTTRAVDAGDEAVLITYTRPGSQLTLDVATVFIRQGGVVSQVVHLGYPIEDTTLIDELTDVTDHKLAELLTS
jgi:tRNA A-37 threonylcarbamoyl transferase component Bud32